MPEVNECVTCALLKGLKEQGESFAKARERRHKSITLCKSAVIREDYYEVDNHLEYGGRVVCNSRPMNFCFECGRKLEEEELAW